MDVNKSHAFPYEVMMLINILPMTALILLLAGVTVLKSGFILAATGLPFVVVLYILDPETRVAIKFFMMELQPKNIWELAKPMLSIQIEPLAIARRIKKAYVRLRSKWPALNSNLKKRKKELMRIIKRDSDHTAFSWRRYKA